MISLALALLLLASPLSSEAAQERTEGELANTLLDFFAGYLAAENRNLEQAVLSENAAELRVAYYQRMSTRSQLGLFFLCPSEAKPFPGETLPEAERYFLELSYSEPALWTGMGLEIVEQIPKTSKELELPGNCRALYTSGTITLRDSTRRLQRHSYCSLTLEQDGDVCMILALNRSPRNARTVTKIMTRLLPEGIQAFAAQTDGA